MKTYYFVKYNHKDTDTLVYSIKATKPKEGGAVYSEVELEPTSIAQLYYKVTSVYGEDVYPWFEGYKGVILTSQLEEFVELVNKDVPYTAGKYLAEVEKEGKITYSRTDAMGGNGHTGRYFKTSKDVPARGAMRKDLSYYGECTEIDKLPCRGFNLKAFSFYKNPSDKSIHGTYGSDNAAVKESVPFDGPYVSSSGAAQTAAVEKMSIKYLIVDRMDFLELADDLSQCKYKISRDKYTEAQAAEVTALTGVDVSVLGMTEFLELINKLNEIRFGV